MLFTYISPSADKVSDAFGASYRAPRPTQMIRKMSMSGSSVPCLTINDCI